MTLAERLASAGVAPSPSAAEPSTARVRESAQAILIEGLAPRLGREPIEAPALAAQVQAAVDAAITADGQAMSRSERERLAQDVSDDLIGHGPLETLLGDDSISEIMVIGPHRVYIERGGQLHPSTAQFRDEAALRRTIDRIVARVGRRVDESSPMVDARLPDGSRVNVVLPPLSLDGPVVTIRRFTSDAVSLDDLLDLGTITARAAEFLTLAVRGRLNVIVSGATGAGKTTTLSVLSSLIPADERIVTIEDAAELRIQQQHVVRLESRPANIEGKGLVTVRDLVRNALRMRPDRIIVGEVRDSAAIDMIAAMSTGHDGSIGTVHANSPRDALARIETMVLTGGAELPLRALRESLSRAIDVIVHQSRERSGARRINAITEVVGMEGDVITLQDIFAIDPSSGLLTPTGLRPTGLDRVAARGIDVSGLDLSPLAGASSTLDAGPRRGWSR